MKLLFWLCCVLVAYAYVGYAVVLGICAHMRLRPIRKASLRLSVSIVMAVKNEAANLPAKLANLNLLDYPRELLQIVVVSDGSTDQTSDILQRRIPDVLPVVLPESQGKAAALNAAVPHTTGQILMFIDARQILDANAVTELVSCFADNNIGGVSGELLLETDSIQTPANALGIYWKIEKALRKLESATGSVVGVTGAIYAIRRELYVDLPPSTILDDVLVPMNIVRQGKRVIFQPTAIARDRIFAEKGKEFSRKVRTLTGNYQLLRMAPWLLTTANPLLFRFVSHKLLRLLVPFLLILMLFAAAFASGPMFHILFVLQVLFYLAAALGGLSPSIRRLKPIAIATTFVMLNAAAAVAFYNFITGRNEVWVR